MFCPNCKAEYRDGFTRCADCEEELVDALPSEALVWNEPVAPGDPDEDPFCAFWSGDDPRLHIELCELLDKESIPHKTVRRTDHLFHISKYPAFQIGIPFSMFERGEAIVKEAYGQEEGPANAAKLLPNGRQSVTDLGMFSTWLTMARGYANSGRYAPGSLEADPRLVLSEGKDAEQECSIVYPKDSEIWYSEDATVEIWTGNQPEMGELLAASLRENQIHSRTTDAGGAQRLFVLPADESRALEIVREVVEGVPPE